MDLTPNVIKITKTENSDTSSVSTTGGPLDRSRRVAFPLPTALAAAGIQSQNLLHDLLFLGQYPLQNNHKNSGHVSVERQGTPSNIFKILRLCPEILYVHFPSQIVHQEG